MAEKTVIVIGASAGGIEAVSALLSQLPENLPAPVLIVLHLAATSSGDFLAYKFRKESKRNCELAGHDKPLKAGTIYLAPPDHHLLVTQNKMLVVMGPHENQFRPAIDTLFRSAAAYFGSGAIGVVLTGMLQDGTIGMEAIKRAGGITVIQDPAEADFPDMPQSVLNNVEVDFKMPLAEIGGLLHKLVTEMPASPALEVPDDLKLEARIAERVMGTVEEADQLGKRVPVSCPDCGGGLWEVTNSSLLRYRCHLGHSYLADTLFNGLHAGLEETLWVVLRMLEERKTLLMAMAEKQHVNGQLTWASAQRERANEMKTHINRIREILLNAESKLSAENPDLKTNSNGN